MPEYRFDVEANIKNAERDIKQLYSLLGKLDTATKNSARVDNSKNDRTTLDLLNKYKEIEKSYNRINTATQKYEQSSNFEGKTSDVQHLNDKLGDTSSLLSKVSQGINNLGSNGGGNLKQYIKDTQNLNYNLGDAAKLQQQLQRITTRVRRTGNEQDRISSKVESTHYMSLRDTGTFTRNQAQLKSFDKDKELINGVIQVYQAKQDTLRQQIATGLSTAGKPMTTDELNSAHYQMNDISKVLKKARGANTAIEAAQETGSSADETLSSSLHFIGSKAALPLAALGIAQKVFGAFKNAIKQGEQVNKSTGEQALNMGNVSGHVSDSEMRGRAQNLMWSNGLGYNTQDSLNYMQLAQQSRAYNPNKANSANLSTSMTNSLEEGGRFSGVSDKTWQSAATAAMESGAVLSSKAIDRLSETLAGQNMRSGNAGNAEQNAKIVTSVIQGLTRAGTVSSGGIKNVAATTAMLSRSSKLFSGEQGAENINSFNQGFLNAGSGNDPALLYMKIQSNPARYGGGARGLLNAEEDLNKGLGDKNNIAWIQSAVRKMGGSGTQGQATAALMLQQHFGWKAETADKVSQDMMSGRYSTSHIQDEIRRIDKKGNLQRRQNEQSYRSSEQAGYNTRDSQREAINSRAAGSTKWWRNFTNNVGKGFNSLFGGGGSSGGSRPTPPAGFSQPGQIGGRNTGTSGGTGKGSLSFKPSAQDFGAPTRVHAATISKKDKPYKGTGSGGVAATSGKVIDQKIQEESRTKAYLNTREMQRNLHSEKTNIDRRQEQLKEAARLLNEERNKHGGGIKGTAGTVGKKETKSSKSKSKSKTSSRSNAKRKVSKPAGSDKKRSSSSSSKVSKKLTNHNNITINMPATTGNPGAVGAARLAAKTVGEKVAEYSRNLIQGD